MNSFFVTKPTKYLQFRPPIIFQFDAEFRRWSVKRSETRNFEDFYKLVERLHRLTNLQFLISYVDPSDNDLLPINNDDNFGRAVSTAKPLLRVMVQRKGTNAISQFLTMVISLFSVFFQFETLL